MTQENLHNFENLELLTSSNPSTIDVSWIWGLLSTVTAWGIQKFVREWIKQRRKLSAYINLIGPIKPRIADECTAHPHSPGTRFHDANRLRIDTKPRRLFARINRLKFFSQNRISFGSEYASLRAKELFIGYRERNRSGKPTFPLELDKETCASEKLVYLTDVEEVVEPNLGFRSTDGTLEGFYKPVRNLRPKRSHLLITKVPSLDSKYQYDINIAGSDYHGTEAFKSGIWKWVEDIYNEVGDGSFMALFRINSLKSDKKGILRAVPETIEKPIILKLKLNSENRFIVMN